MNKYYNTGFRSGKYCIWEKTVIIKNIIKSIIK